MIALPKLREVLKNTLTLTNELKNEEWAKELKNEEWTNELKNEKWANKLKNKEWTNDVFEKLKTIALSQIEKAGYDKVKNEIKNIISGCPKSGGGGENANSRPISDFDIMVLWVGFLVCIFTAYYKFLSAVGGWIGGSKSGDKLLQTSIDELLQPSIDELSQTSIDELSQTSIDELSQTSIDKLAKDKKLTTMVVSLIGLLGPTKEKTDTGKTDTLISSIICHMNKNNLVTGMGKKAKKKTKKAKKKAKKKTKKRQKKVKKKPKNQKAKKSKKRQKAKKPKKAKKSQKKES